MKKGQKARGGTLLLDLLFHANGTLSHLDRVEDTVGKGH
jgi:hypothetical protein